jgi:hypothetical protein
LPGGTEESHRKSLEQKLVKTFEDSDLTAKKTSHFTVTEINWLNAV